MTASSSSNLSIEKKLSKQEEQLKNRRKEEFEKQEEIYQAIKNRQEIETIKALMKNYLATYGNHYSCAPFDVFTKIESSSEYLNENILRRLAYEEDEASINWVIEAPIFVNDIMNDPTTKQEEFLRANLNAIASGFAYRGDKERVDRLYDDVLYGNGSYKKYWDRLHGAEMPCFSEGVICAYILSGGEKGQDKNPELKSGIELACEYLDFSRWEKEKNRIPFKQDNNESLKEITRAMQIKGIVKNHQKAHFISQIRDEAKREAMAIWLGGGSLYLYKESEQLMREAEKYQFTIDQAVAWRYSNGVKFFLLAFYRHCVQLPPPKPKKKKQAPKETSSKAMDQKAENVPVKQDRIRITETLYFYILTFLCPFPLKHKDLLDFHSKSVYRFYSGRMFQKMKQTGGLLVNDSSFRGLMGFK